MSEYAESIVRVRYAETDQMGVVYHSNYLIWFEVGRVDLCRTLGFEYRDMELQEDSFLVVAEAYCRYKSPARFDDTLIIRTSVTQAQKRMLKFAYEVLQQATGQVLATGSTTHVICDSQGRPRSLPEKYRHFFGISGRHPATAEIGFR
jgi:acyl-CoA thioester hydrolase